ncbi:MAG: DUF692 family multinuclear iron-containing protein [Flavobacteriales bacterium]
MKKRTKIITASLIAAGTIFTIAGVSANTSHETTSASSSRASLEIKCGGKDHSCGADTSKTKDHKCGEAKCGSKNTALVPRKKRAITNAAKANAEINNHHNNGGLRNSSSLLSHPLKFLLMVGIGFRKDFAEDFLASSILKPSFIEVAPENWMDVGGYWKKQLHKALEKHPLFTHGLSLSVGSPDELDIDFLKKIKAFLKETNAKIYSEHLSYSKCDNAHLYDLLPIPFTDDAVRHVAKRIQQVQDVLEREIAIEIVSYYTPVAPEMSELQFVNEVLREANCKLLLDVNNVYVNSFNHQYNPHEFIDGLAIEKTEYIHMAGHTKVSEDLIIDTHGQAIIDPVYDLFAYTISKLEKDVPVLLERDFNIPQLEELQGEIQQLQKIKNSAYVAA